MSKETVEELSRDVNSVPLGYADGRPIRMSYEQRRQHSYVIGVNGTGKTTLLRQFAYSDMMQNPKHGLCVIDPHGDLIDDILSLIPEDRLSDVILFDPSREDHPFCLNLFAPIPEPTEVGRVASEIVSIFRKILGPAWRPEIEGVVQSVTLTLLARSKDYRLMGKPWIPAIDEIPALLAMERVPEEDREKPPWRRRVHTYRAQFYTELQRQDQIPVWEFWNYNFDTLTPRPRSELSLAVLNAVRRFLSNPTVRNIVAQTENRLDLGQVMQEGKILLVNLSKGKLGEANSAFLGSVLVAKLVVAVFARASLKPDERRPFHIIVDEFQNFAISSFPSLLSEGRKYGVDLVIAHQYRDQLRDWVQGATTNAGNFLVFRVGGEDALELAREFDATPPPGEWEIRPTYRPLLRRLPDPDKDRRWEWQQRLQQIIELEEEIPQLSDDKAAKITTSAIKRIMALLDSTLMRKQSWAESGRRVNSGYSPDDLRENNPYAGHEVAGSLRRIDGVVQWTPAPNKPLYPRAIATDVVGARLPMLYEDEFQEGLLAYRKRTEAKLASIPSEPDEKPPITEQTPFVQYEVNSINYTHFHRLPGQQTERERLFHRERGRQRSYADVYQENANRLVHLPNYHAAVRIAGSATAPIETVVRIDEWPDGINPRNRQQAYLKNSETAWQNSLAYTRTRADVQAELNTRYQSMLASIGMSWHPDEPLPSPQVLYEEDD